MKLTKLMTIAVVATVLLSVAANAQEGFNGFRQGTTELTLGGSGSSDKNFDDSAFSVNGSWGYFFADNWEVALRQEIRYGNSDWGGATRVAIDAHMDLDNIQPFIGASFGGLYGEDVDATFVAGPEAGVKVLVKDDAFVYAIVAYEFFFEDTGDADEAWDDGRFVYGVGIGLTW